MGIRGLTTYIAERSDYYFENYELNNTNLVIDGNSLSCQLFTSTRHTNCAFGGDYDVFAYAVTRFFSDLLRCNVTPIVILDGGWEDKKFSTIIKRIKDRLRIANNPSLILNNSIVFSSLLPEVLISIMKKMNIKHLMSTFEADDAIAGLARVLNCPVLSYDSDFYIYGVMYIPYNTLDNYVTKTSEGYVKRCKIFEYKKLLERFKGLDITHLPLVSILLGNDYIDRKIFANFFYRLCRSKSKYSYNTEQQKIHRVFNWLKNYTLHEAIHEILIHVADKKRCKVIEDIENVVNSYLNISTEILRLLEFDEKFVEDVEKNIKIFKYDECLVDANGVVSDEDDNNYDDNESLDNDDDNSDVDENVDDYHSNTEFQDSIDEDEELKLLEKISNPIENDIEHQFESSMPDWFLKKIHSCEYPGSFVNLFTHKVMLMRTQVEEMSLPSADDISHPIITQICSLLFTLENKINENGTNHKTVRLIGRKDCNLATIHLNIPNDAPIDLKLMEKYSFTDKKKVFDEILGITNKYNLEELPISWRLYVAIILYWIQQKDCLPERTKIHLDCLLLAMLLGILDEKIGHCRSKINFEKKHGKTIWLNELQSKNKLDKVRIEDLSNDLMTLLNSVSINDCVAAAPFFIEHFGVDPTLQQYPQKFLPEVVHVFAQFQSCLKYSMQLNALLDDIYEPPFISDFFSGTLLYNLFNNFKTRENIDNYLATRLENAPVILKIFQLLKLKVLKILDECDLKICDGEKNLRRKRKKNKKKKSSIVDDNSEDKNRGAEDIGEHDLDSSFHDPNNRFALLTIN